MRRRYFVIRRWLRFHLTYRLRRWIIDRFFTVFLPSVFATAVKCTVKAEMGHERLIRWRFAVAPMAQLMAPPVHRPAPSASQSCWFRMLLGIGRIHWRILAMVGDSRRFSGDSWHPGNSWAFLFGFLYLWKNRTWSQDSWDSSSAALIWWFRFDISFCLSSSRIKKKLKKSSNCEDWSGSVENLSGILNESRISWIIFDGDVIGFTSHRWNDNSTCDVSEILERLLAATFVILVKSSGRIPSGFSMILWCPVGHPCYISNVSSNSNVDFLNCF